MPSSYPDCTVAPSAGRIAEANTIEPNQHNPIPPDPRHEPVLIDDAETLLCPTQDQTLVDLTAGLGGHAARLARHLAPTATVLLIDRDPTHLEHAAETVRDASPARVITRHAPFSSVGPILEELGLAADILLADLGFASSQIDDPARGLSFRADGPLDMRLDPTTGITAADLVADLSEDELAQTIRTLGEERHARRVARKIVEARNAGPITSTSMLAAIVRQAIPTAPRRPKPAAGRQRPHQRPIDPATRTFQALRIAVNDELGDLDRLLAWIATAAEHAITRPSNEPTTATGPPTRARPGLHSGARVGIISFHSLEDRPVKHAFADLERRGLAERLTRKPVTAGDNERAANPRARSAKLRVLRIGSANTA